MERGRAPPWRGAWILVLLPALAGGQPLAAGEAAYEEWRATGVRGRAVELSCGPPAAAPPAVVFWSFTPQGEGLPRAVAVGSGREVAVAPGTGALGRVTLRNGTLELRELREAAQGRFLCQGLFPERGRLRVGYAAVLLRVLVPVSKPFVRPTAAAAAEGAAVALTCTVREGTEPLSFSWQHQEPRGGPSVTPAGLGGSRAELQLTPANRSHTGWYICTVHNEVNNRTSDPVYLDIVYGPDEPAIRVEPFSPEQGGFSAGEREDVVLSCLAPSNPPSRYVWLHNGSQVHTGQTYVIPAIARAQAGTYTCLAENSHLQTRTQATIVLTVYYPPAGSPSCSALASDDQRDVALRCRWLGGFPLARLRWVGPQEEEEEEEGLMGSSFSMATRIQSGAATRNGSSFSCLASHPALPLGAACGTTLWVPPGSPRCAAAATKGDEYVMLRCGWQGGTPPVTLRWRDSAGRALGDPAASLAVLVLGTDGSLAGREFVCAAAHPLRAAAAECRLRLGKPAPSPACRGGVAVPAHSVPPCRRAEVPELQAESEVAVLEGGEAQLACRQRGSSAGLGATVAWYDPKEREVTAGLAKYQLEQGEAWVNLTVRDAEWPGDSGIYRCTATNAVGTASLPVRLRVDRYPAPPNVTISKLRYTRARTEVRLEWRTQGAGNLTGFVVQRRQTKKPLRETASPWETAAGDIEPHSRDRRLGGLDPAVLYAFRVLAVNHRTAGHPSEVQTPGEVGRGCSVGAEQGLSGEGQRVHPVERRSRVRAAGSRFQARARTFPGLSGLRPSLLPAMFPLLSSSRASLRGLPGGDGGGGGGDAGGQRSLAAGRALHRPPPGDPAAAARPAVPHVSAQTPLPPPRARHQRAPGVPQGRSRRPGARGHGGGCWSSRGRGGGSRASPGRLVCPGHGRRAALGSTRPQR
ncbi:V-set and immunoglobulin domain-containing protein 10-like 2 isoform X3 [Passer montanus]|uniref:V-set and immunoglobulin domain-containing protein 10-like 2 isoform X3 n=1 Tax=Passer montanus TaxID=9160 RepID=UPI00196099C7|nr:V-set and immunoglobulin domain-containing protein 10-like 2 isoform X3 [Passer montanus]